MIYLKSIIAGMLTLLLAAVIIYVAAFVAILVIFKPDGIDFPIWHLHTKSAAFWLVVTLIFSLGFVWEFRRLSN